MINNISDKKDKFNQINDGNTNAQGAPGDIESFQSMMGATPDIRGSSTNTHNTETVGASGVTTNAQEQVDENAEMTAEDEEKIVDQMGEDLVTKILDKTKEIQSQIKEELDSEE